MKRIGTPASSPDIDLMRSSSSVSPPAFRVGMTTRARARAALRTSPPPRSVLMPTPISFRATTRAGPGQARESGEPYTRDGSPRACRIADQLPSLRGNTDRENGPAYQWVRMEIRRDIPDPSTAHRLWHPQQVLDELARQYEVRATYQKGNSRHSVGMLDAPFIGTVEMFGGHWSIRPGEGVEYRIKQEARAVDHAFTVLRLHRQGKDALAACYRTESVDEKGVIELAPKVFLRLQ